MLRAILCATDLEVDAELNLEFSTLLSNPARLKQEDARLYMLAKEIIITAGLEADVIHHDDILQIASALVAIERCTG